MSDTISLTDPAVIISGIRQFGLAPDGSDLRDLESAMARRKDQIDRLRKSLQETTAEAVEHRDDIIKARDADFQHIANPHFRETYEQEIARMDALIERARATLASAQGSGAA